MEYLDKFLNKIKPYSAVPNLRSISQKIGISEKSIIKIDANENPYGFPKKLLIPLAKKVNWSLYPDATQTELRNQLSAYTGLPPNWIFAANGSDEIIDYICRFLPNKSSILLFPPTFSYYEHIVHLNQKKLLLGKRKRDFSLDLENAATFKNKPAVVFLCSPNNPTGNLISNSELEFFLKWKSLIVLDEAYYEFSQKSGISFLKKHPNLIILRTFSKAFALAGLRLGYALLHPKLQQQFNSVKYPYNVNQVTEVAADLCFKNFHLFKKNINAICKTRQKVWEDLQKQPKVTAFPSQANFILCKIKQHSAKNIYQKLFQQGIIIRYFSTSLLKNYIRFSIGTPNQMNKFLKTFNNLLR